MLRLVLTGIGLFGEACTVLSYDAVSAESRHPFRSLHDDDEIAYFTVR